MSSLGRPDDIKQIVVYFDATGMVDYFGVASSGCDSHNTLANVIPNMSYPRGLFPYLAARISINQRLGTRAEEKMIAVHRPRIIRRRPLRACLISSATSLLCAL